MHWADTFPAQAKREGISPLVAHEFVESSHGQKVRDLPERVQHKRERGAAYPAQFRW